MMGAPRRSVRSERGQALVEFALAIPFITLVALGVVEVSYALLDAHVVTRLSREGANMISRETTLQDGVTALKGMSTRPVNLDDGSSTVIFSVVRLVGTVGAANYNKPVLYERCQYGTFPATSKLTTAGLASFGGPPNYQAPNSDNDPNLRVTNFPAGLLVVPGGMIYVAEIYTRHQLITPFDRFGVQLPRTLYSIAYF
jgi:hypothetical protein